MAPDPDFGCGVVYEIDAFHAANSLVPVGYAPRRVSPPLHEQTSPPWAPITIRFCLSKKLPIRPLAVALYSLLERSFENLKAFHCESEHQCL
jgi:hypothetical protein